MVATRASQEVADLFRVKPGEFVRARNALAARLRKAGRDSDAREVSRMPKPTPAVWAINQIAGADTDEVKKFLHAIEQLGRAQFTDAATATAAMDAQRSSLQRLVERAAETLNTAKLHVSPEVHRRLSATLLGAAADPQARDELRRGRITRERAAPGLEVLARARPRSRGVSAGREDSEAARRRERPDAGPVGARREAQSRIRRQLQAAQADTRNRERRARELERVALHQRRTAESAAKAAEKLRARLREIDAHATAARRVADNAAAAAERARADANEAARRPAVRRDGLTR